MTKVHHFLAAWGPKDDFFDVKCFGPLPRNVLPTSAESIVLQDYMKNPLYRCRPKTKRLGNMPGAKLGATVTLRAGKRCGRSWEQSWGQRWGQR